MEQKSDNVADIDSNLPANETVSNCIKGLTHQEKLEQIEYLYLKKKKTEEKKKRKCID